MIKFLLISLFLITSAQAANLPALAGLFQKNFNTFYQPRMCAKNIERLVQAAKANRIDMKNAFVLKIVGGGFWETSAFYARGNPNQRTMLGYFHYVLVADNHVFDFDLAEPLVLPFQDYIRLQFGPKSTDAAWMKTMSADLPGWEMTRYEWEPYASYSNLNATWIQRLDKLINVPQTMSKKRVR